MLLAEGAAVEGRALGTLGDGVEHAARVDGGAALLGHGVHDVLLHLVEAFFHAAYVALEAEHEVFALGDEGWHVALCHKRKVLQVGLDEAEHLVVRMARHGHQFGPFAAQPDGVEAFHGDAGVVQREEVGVDGELPRDGRHVEHRRGLDVGQMDAALAGLKDEVNLAGVVLHVGDGVFAFEEAQAVVLLQAEVVAPLVGGRLEAEFLGEFDVLVDVRAAFGCAGEHGLGYALVLVGEEAAHERRCDAAERQPRGVEGVGVRLLIEGDGDGGKSYHNMYKCICSRIEDRSGPRGPTMQPGSVSCRLLVGGVAYAQRLASGRHGALECGQRLQRRETGVDGHEVFLRPRLRHLLQRPV